jgi:hypothetical protein
VQNKLAIVRDKKAELEKLEAHLITALRKCNQALKRQRPRPQPNGGFQLTLGRRRSPWHGVQASARVARIAWDVDMVYGPKAQWNGDLPPVPDFFTHQTSAKGSALRRH